MDSIPLLSDLLKESDSLPHCVVTIAGGPASGKTTLALSISDETPVFFVDTERRLIALAEKMGFGTTKKSVYHLTAGSWPEMVKALRQAAQHIKLDREEGQTDRVFIIIDSGTDFKNFAHSEWQNEGPVFPVVTWNRLYEKMSVPMRALKALDISIIFTVQVKKLYVKDQWDGTSYIPDMFKNQEYNSDIVIQIMEDSSLVVHKNSFADKSTWQETSNLISRDDRLPNIIRTLVSV